MVETTSSATVANPNPLERELGTGGVYLEAEELETQKAATGKPPVGQQPLILGRFKTQQDLEKAYKELEKAYTQVSQKKAALEKELTALSKDELRTEPVEKSSSYSGDVDEFYSKFLEDPVGVLNPMVEEMVKKAVVPIVEPLYREREVQTVKQTIAAMRQKYPDLDIYSKQIADVVENEIPKNSNLPIDKMLEFAYGIVKTRNLSQQTETATVEKNRQEILQGQSKGFVESGVGASVRGSPVKAVEQQIRESILNAESVNPLFE